MQAAEAPGIAAASLSADPAAVSSVGVPAAELTSELHESRPKARAGLQLLQASRGGGAPPPLPPRAAPAVTPPPAPVRGGGAGARNHGTGGATAAPLANNANESGDAMSEEEAFQELCRSMREQ